MQCFPYLGDEATKARKVQIIDRSTPLCASVISRECKRVRVSTSRILIVVRTKDASSEAHFELGNLDSKSRLDKNKPVDMVIIQLEHYQTRIAAQVDTLSSSLPWDNVPARARTLSREKSSMNFKICYQITSYFTTDIASSNIRHRLVVRMQCSQKLKRSR